MANTITVTFGADQKNLKKALEEMPEDVKRALNRATTHTTTFSDTFSKMFSRGDPGERRFHGLVGSLVRDMSSLQGGATGAGQAISTMLTRVGGAGIGAGAGLVAVGVALERMISRGEELRKMGSEISKETQKMGHALRLATAAEGFSALAEKAREFHKEARKAADEAEKEDTHSIRRAANRRAAYYARHPADLVAPGGLDRANKYAEDEANKVREKAAEQAKIVAQFDALAVSAQQKSVEIAKAQLSGSAEQVANLKLQLEYIQKRAEVEQLARRNPERGAEAMAALDAEFRIREKMVQAQAQAAEREFKARVAAGQFSQQQALMEGKIVDIQNSALSTNEKQLAIARERVALAEAGIEAAQAEVKAAQEQVDAAKELTEEERRTAALRLQSAQTREIQARSAGRQAAGGVAETRAGQLERAGAEEEMSQDEQWKQYWQREKQRQGLVRAAAKKGINPNLIEGPQYGEAEYDPLRKFKAAASQEERLKMSASSGAVGAQQQIEINKALQKAGQKPVETPKAGQLGVLLPEKGLEGLKPEEKAKVEAQIPVMRVIGVSGGTPVTVIMTEKDKEGEGDKKSQPGQQPSPQPSPQPSQPAAQQAAQPQAGPQAPAAIKPETLEGQGIDPSQSMSNVDVNKLREIQANKEAYDAYWNRPDVQQGQADQRAISAEAAVGIEEDYGKREGYELEQQQQDQARADKQQQSDWEQQRMEAVAGAKQSKRDEKYNQQQLQRQQQSEFEQQTSPQALREPPAEATVPLDVLSPGGEINKMYKPEGVPGTPEPGGEHPPEAGREDAEDEVHKQTLVAKAITSLPPELAHIGGRLSPAVAIAQELINPESLQGAELTPRQQVELHKKQGTKEDDPEYSKARQQLMQEEQAAAFTKQKGLPTPEYIQKHREQEEGGPTRNLALEAVQRMQGGATAEQALKPLPPPPTIEAPPPPAQPQQASRQGGGMDRGIVQAIKEAITSTMDKYWR